MTTTQPPIDAAALSAEAHAFLAARVPRRSTEARAWGQGSDAVMGVATHHGEEERREVQAAQAWQRELYDAGLAWVDGPVAYGGRGLGAEHARAVRQAMAEYELPNTGCFMVSFEIVGPTILEHGTEEQKVWSSGAHYSQLGELLARTGTQADRNRGITAFLVEMDRPGVQVRPLRQITGSSHFNEVFFDEVVLSDEERLGPLNGGWTVASTGLGGERSVMSDEDNGILNRPVRKLFALARQLGVADDPAIVELLGEAWARDQVLHVTGERLAAADGPPGSIAKLQMTANSEFFVAIATRLLGHRLAVDTGEWGTYAWAEVALSIPAHRIAGGSDEIQRNIIAERLLGLPRELRPDQVGS